MQLQHAWAALARSQTQAQQQTRREAAERAQLQLASYFFQQAQQQTQQVTVLREAATATELQGAWLQHSLTTLQQQRQQAEQQQLVSLLLASTASSLVSASSRQQDRGVWGDHGDGHISDFPLLSAGRHYSSQADSMQRAQLQNALPFDVNGFLSSPCFPQRNVSQADRAPLPGGLLSDLLSLRNSQAQELAVLQRVRGVMQQTQRAAHGSDVDGRLPLGLSELSAFRHGGTGAMSANLSAVPDNCIPQRGSGLQQTKPTVLQTATYGRSGIDNSSSSEVASSQMQAHIDACSDGRHLSRASLPLLVPGEEAPVTATNRRKRKSPSSHDQQPHNKDRTPS